MKDNLTNEKKKRKEFHWFSAVLYIFDKPDPFHLPFGKGLARLMSCNSMDIFSMLLVRISLALQRNHQEKKRVLLSHD